MLQAIIQVDSMNRLGLNGLLQLKHSLHLYLFKSLYYAQGWKKNRKNTAKSSSKLFFYEWGRHSSDSHEWKIVCFLPPCLMVTFSAFKIHYGPDKSVTNPWSVFHLQKKLRGGTLFFLPTAEGISWINQALKTTVVKSHAEDSCKELNCNVTNKHLQQVYWNRRHHLNCPARPAQTTTGLNKMFLPVWFLGGERSGKFEVTWCELSQVVLVAYCGDNSQL